MEHGILWFLAGVSGGLLIGAAPLRRPLATGMVALRLLGVFGSSLVGYLVFLRLGYAEWNWVPFSHSTALLLAVVAIAVGNTALFARTGLGLLRSSIVGAASFVPSFFLIALASGVCSCLSGDCL